MCAAHDPIVHYYAHDHMFGGINFGDLVKKNSPICRQIKIPTKVSGYMVLTTVHWVQLSRRYIGLFS